MRGLKTLLMGIVVLMAALGGGHSTRAQGVAYAKQYITESQSAQLNHPWDYPPGVYRFIPAYDDLCLAVQWAAWPDAPHLAQLGCGVSPDIAVIPIARPGNEGYYGYYTFRASNQIDSQGRLNRCATEARNVVIGPPRIDVQPCDLQPGETDWSFAGGVDQKFSMADSYNRSNQRAAGVVRIRGGAKCWTLRGSSRDPMADVMFEPCADLQNQAFSIRYVGPITSPGDLAALNRAGWRPGPPGEPMRLAVPARDVDIPGYDYAADPTENDGGEACAIRCAGDVRCAAFTWTPRTAAQPARCYLKTTWGTPRTSEGMYSGIVVGYRGPRL